MNGHYAYTPYIWPMLTSAVFMAALGVYGWQRRTVPAALPFAIVMSLFSLSAMSAALQLAAVDIPAKIFWFKSQYFLGGPNMVAGLCFVLAYARLDRFLTRFNLIPLFIFILVGSLLVLTNDIHHWVWTGFTYYGGEVHSLNGGADWILTSIAYLLTFLNLPILIWLFIRSPGQRWPVALILCGQIVVRVMLLLDRANANPVAPMDPTILASNFLAVMYAVALFGFRIFDPIPMARKTVIEQMQEGMLVLDTSHKIVDLNPAAEKLLGLPAARLRGRDLAEVLPAHAEMSIRSDGGGAAQFEVGLGNETVLRSYTLDPSPLKDRNGQTLGYLLLLHDVTEQKRAQAQLMEHQRALAALKEREQLARELHDGLGQVLGYVKMQAQAARERLAQDQKEIADGDLAQLMAVAQDAHADVREYILGARSGVSSEPGFLPALRQYLQRFAETYKMRAELIPPPDGTDAAFEPTVEAQLLRIIQEALTNARKHAQAKSVQVSIELEDSRAQVIVQDDGAGFDPALLEAAEGQKFGLRFMRERAEDAGGSLEVQSAPGAGTRVIIHAPRRKE